MVAQISSTSKYVPMVLLSLCFRLSKTVTKGQIHTFLNLLDDHLLPQK